MISVLFQSRNINVAALIQTANMKGESLIMSIMFPHVNGEAYDPYLHCVDDNTERDNDEQESQYSDAETISEPD